MDLRAVNYFINEYSDKLMNQMVALYQPQTQDNEATIRATINRFEQLTGSIAKRLADKNPIVLRAIPQELQDKNRFRDITQWKQYDDLVKVLKSVETKKQDPYKQAIEYFKAKDRYADTSIIGNYVARFKKALPSLIQGVESNDPNIISLIPEELLKDKFYQVITNWRDFHALEQLLDGAFAETSDENVILNSAETDGDKVYENKENGIEIFKGDAEHKCIRYGNNQYYSWCISRTKGSMYGGYRFMNQGGSNRMFYFVFDRTQPDTKTGSNSFENNYHAVVIHPLENGKYVRSIANNSGDKPYQGCSWEELGDYFEGADGKRLWNKIKGLKSIFVFNEPSSEERRQKGLQGQRLSLDAFMDLELEDKQAWLRVNATDNNLVTSEIVKSLPSHGEISKNDLINHGRIFNYSELKDDVKLAKRYSIYRYTRFPEDPLPYPLVRFLDENAQMDYYKKFEEDFLTYEIIEEYFGEAVIKDYIATQLKVYSYLPEGAIKYMDDTQKKIFSVYSVTLTNLKVISKSFDPEMIPSAVEQTASIDKIDYGTFINMDPKIKAAYLKMLKTLPPKNEYVVFIWGSPITFVNQDQFYFILPEDRNEPKICVMINESGKVLYKGIVLLGITFSLNGTVTGAADRSSFPVGKSTIYLKEDEYDTISMELESGEQKKLTKKDIQSILSEEYNSNKYLWQHRAGIIK